MTKAKIPLTENVTYQLFDKNGEAKSIFKHNFLGRALMKLGLDMKGFLFGSNTMAMTISNLVTNAGYAFVAARIISDSTEDLANYIAVGTSSTAAAATQTALGAEIVDSGLARATATLSRVTTTETNDTAQLVKQFTVSGTKAVTESGIFNAASAGTMVARQVFSAINVSSGDTLQISWKLSVSS